MTTTKQAGRETASNKWRAELTVDWGEWLRMGREWLLDGVQNWPIEFASVEQRGGLAVVSLPTWKPNLVVASGVHDGLDLRFGLGGSETISMGVDDGTSNPVDGTSSSSAGSTNRRLVLLQNVSRNAKVVSSDGTFTDANVAFVIKRLFLSAAAAGTADAAGDLQAMTDVFTHDNTPFSSWSETFTAEWTGAGA